MPALLLLQADIEEKAESQWLHGVKSRHNLPLCIIVHWCYNLACPDFNEVQNKGNRVAIAELITLDSIEPGSR